jgi:hypothetical protein
VPIEKPKNETRLMVQWKYIASMMSEQLRFRRAHVISGRDPELPESCLRRQFERFDWLSFGV